MTWPGIEPRSPGPLANTLLIRPMSRLTIKQTISLYGSVCAQKSNNIYMYTFLYFFVWECHEVRLITLLFRVNVTWMTILSLDSTTRYNRRLTHHFFLHSRLKVVKTTLNLSNGWLVPINTIATTTITTTTSTHTHTHTHIYIFVRAVQRF